MKPTDKNRKVTPLFATAPAIEAHWESAAPAGERLPQGLTITSFAESKFVEKPWGHEHWLVHEGSPFAFKSIALKAGERTSLQYHQRKEEASLLVTGRVRLHFAEKAGAAVQTIEIGPGTLWHVRPGTVHRMEALTDVLFLEVSTPELDDVIRLEDDRQRGNGRVDTEHSRPRKRA